MNSPEITQTTPSQSASATPPVTYTLASTGEWTNIGLQPAPMPQTGDIYDELAEAFAALADALRNCAAAAAA